MDEWWGQFAVGEEVQLWLIFIQFNTVFYRCRVDHGHYPRMWWKWPWWWCDHDRYENATSGQCHHVPLNVSTESVVFFLKDATVHQSKNNNNNDNIMIQCTVLSSPVFTCWDSGGMGWKKNVWTIQPLEEPKQMRLGLHLSLSYPEKLLAASTLILDMWHTGRHSMALNYY